MFKFPDALLIQIFLISSTPATTETTCLEVQKSAAVIVMSDNKKINHLLEKSKPTVPVSGGNGAAVVYKGKA